MLTLAQLKKLIKKYDDMLGIDVKGKSLEELTKEVQKAGYTIDHENKELIHKDKGKKMKRRPEKVKLPPPAPKKSEADKEEGKKKKHEATIKYILKNKEILKDARIKKLL